MSRYPSLTFFFYSLPLPRRIHGSSTQTGPARTWPIVGQDQVEALLTALFYKETTFLAKWFADFLASGLDEQSP